MLTKNILANKVINEQPDKQAVQMQIIGLLERIVLLYQIPNWSDKNGLLLSEWVMDNYKFETMEVIITCLKNPPKMKDTSWRLTPDTINSWFAFELERQAEIREKEHQKRKESELRLALLPEVDNTLTDEQRANVDKLLNEYKEAIKATEIKSVRPMTQEEIEREGRLDNDPFKQWKKANGY